MVIAIEEDSKDILGAAAIPICVDFDGTLTLRHSRLERVLGLAKHSPRSFLELIFGASGMAAFQNDLALRSNVDVTALPLRSGLLEWLNLEHRAGRRLVLVIDSDQGTIDKLALQLPQFESCSPLAHGVGSPSDRKRRALVERFGEHGFDYVGSDPADEIVWKSARRAIVIGDRHLAARVERVSEVSRLFSPSPPTLQSWAEAVRLHQWVKNLLVFLPALLAHSILNSQILLQSLLAFLAFGLCASSVYLLNDLFDLGADQAHPRKRNRPLAAGIVTPRAALYVSAVLLLAAALIALAINLAFAAVLACYYALTSAYSLRLKRIALLDVMVLATLYTIRIIAGAAASGVPLSFWLLAFSVFMFLSLGLVKRYAELDAVRRAEYPGNSGRAYDPSDLPLILSLGTAAGYCAIVVIALYINSTDSQTLYHYHMRLWLICPLMLFWISRVWLLTTRGRMHDDPVVFAVRDTVSLATLGLLALIVAVSI
jgi:4-hydroxybenzoate polyprenyltransferase